MSLPSAPTPGSAAERVYDFAKWAILNAVYAGGDVITEAGLAHEVGVSRTPVREALLRLQDAADNAVLSAIYRMLRERQTLFTSVMVRGRVDRMDATITEHEGILEALRGDDEAAFCSVVNDHLRWSTELARESH